MYNEFLKRRGRPSLKNKLFENIDPEQFSDDDMHFTSIKIRVKDFVKIMKRYGAIRPFIEKKVAEEDERQKVCDKQGGE